MRRANFDTFFSGVARRHLVRAIRDALTEDGPDLTSNAVFGEGDALSARIVSKQDAVVAGLPLLSLVLEETAALEPGAWTQTAHVEEGSLAANGSLLASIDGSARIILRAERVILNFLCHLSGIATLTRRYADILEGTGVRLLDTRKTLPGLRYPEKYAVLVGGGSNHRLNLSEMLMLKDNHIDAAGGILPAVERLRLAYDPAPPIEVECRTLDEAREAVACDVRRIMLDNMSREVMQQALLLVPPGVEVEISGGVDLAGVAALTSGWQGRKPDYVSVGRLTHSAPAADFSMRIGPREPGPAPNAP
ncbi:MAG: carboxylating nicotinate-nucleotide diphosphorylase [Desulfovibrio sp.]|jgi:nicotinate-nucleotide pyrophosphorylase (carboxylating)|nr:carboxylating nicotinate-nucleotide diphosphorylase [Desulfovibrio sp.]